MMLYEAVQLQRGEAFYDYAKMRDANIKPKVQRRNSTDNVQNFANPSEMARRGSYVVGQKLRESKWFQHDELRVFCAVIETGFIVQRKDEEGDIECGIAVWVPGQEKSKNANLVKIYSLYPHKDNYKVAAFDLLDFWPENMQIRIFNQSDRTETAHNEESIRLQIANAENAKQKWHNSEHFTYWCRYGPLQMNQRIRNMTDTRWGINAGIHMIKKRIRRITTSR